MIGLMRRLPPAIAVVFLVVACGGTQPASPGATSAASPGSAPSAPAASVVRAPSPTSAAGLTYVAFGDSWPYGAHCNGCTPFPVLLVDGLAAATGKHIDFRNLVTDGGTAEALAQQIQALPAIQAQIAAADIIVIAIGGNDLEPAFIASEAGRCGGMDDLDCFRAVGKTLRTAYDEMLAKIESLRAGRPTAVRLIAGSNEYLADPYLVDLLGADFGKTKGVTVTRLLRDLTCEVAVAHHARCVDLGPALNGPDLLTPNDVNQQSTMQLVADEILAVGLHELGT